MRPFVDAVVKRNLKAYRTVRRLYDWIKFGSHSGTDKKRFRTRINQLAPYINKFLNLSHKPDVNVVLITIDCLRWDHVYDYFRETMPFLYSLNGYRTSLISTSPWTYPAIASLLTGFYPHNHGAILEGKLRKFDPSKLKPLKRNIITLSELLTFFGYSTYFDSGIDLAFLSIRGRFNEQRLTSLANAGELLNNLQKWILNQDTPFFAHVHLKDPHEPLNPPKEFYDYFGRVSRFPKIGYWGNFQKPENQKGKEFEEFKKNKILLYDNTLRYVDYVLEQFYIFLEDNGLTDNTILIITADHGEEFWDHADIEAKHFYDVRGYAGVGHGHNVFNELIRVPLIITGPGVPKKEETDKSVSGVDIVPTLLDLLGIHYNIHFDGMNIFTAPKKRLILSESTIHGYEKKALVYGTLKFIYSKDDGVAWVFNLKKDPKEQNPIVDDELSTIFIKNLKKLTFSKLLYWGVQ